MHHSQNKSAGSHSIQVFSDGGYTLHERKNFHVETAEKPKRGRIGFAALFGIFMMLPGLPLLIIGSTSTDEGRLAMIIPGAVMMSIGGFALFMWIVAVIQKGSTEDSLSVVITEAGSSASTNIELAMGHTVVQSQSTNTLQNQQPSTRKQCMGWDLSSRCRRPRT